MRAKKYCIVITGLNVLIVICLLHILDGKNQKICSEECCSAGQSLVGRHEHISKTLLDIQRRIIYPPKERTFVPMEGNLTYFSQVGQDKFVDNLLKGRKNGFFVECGAGDGKMISNSAFFEQERGWTGLLIEANPHTFKRLQANKRSAYLINNCLSLQDKPTRMTFKSAGPHGGLVEGFAPSHVLYLKKKTEQLTQVQQCYPLSALLLALNRTHVDYFSLDIEGPELEILQTFPWNKFTIDVLTIEFKVLKPPDGKEKYDYDESARKFHKIKDYMLGTGLYQYAGVLPFLSIPEQALDVVFVRNDLPR